MEDKVRTEIENLKDKLIELRRYFHMHPELGFEEHGTRGRILTYLSHVFNSKEGPYSFAKTGLLYTLKGKNEDKAILLRADMDALPIQEENDVLYRSINNGIMHACGHDGHMAMLIITAEILARHRDELKGTAKFVFQPSEEKLPGGANQMIKEGALEDPKPNMVFALHLSTDNPVGIIGLKSGPVLAFADEFNLTVFGKSGHAALSHEAVDAIEICDHIRSAWRTILTREISPTEPAVIHIGVVKGGSASNVVADKIEIRGTVRAFNPELRQFIADRMKKISLGVAKAMRAKAIFKYEEGYPALINDAGAVSFVSRIAEKVDGLKLVETKPEMGGEDFAYFLERVPGCFAWLGAANEAKGFNYPHHSSHFDFDEDALCLGVEVLVRLVLEYLK